jgi:small subunit ribosomal protein S5e
MQFHGRNTGKKVKAIRIIRHTFEIIHLLTGRNPLEVFISAIKMAGPREDSTRIGAGGVVRKQAVDVSPLRRVNQSIYLITQGAREHSFRAQRTIAECLAD